LRAVLVAERIKQKYVMMNVSENAHDYAQNDIADRDATATEAAAGAKSAVTLQKVTISIKMLQSAAKNLERLSSNFRINLYILELKRSVDKDEGF